MGHSNVGKFVINRSTRMWDPYTSEPIFTRFYEPHEQQDVLTFPLLSLFVL